ncbi:hypothetical protein SAMN02982929_00093 [Saccharopolyspora kobensis]|uniref:Uncharacterized protein n=1 Tax=Saccharopolyspora kobensis TaxID=146035 RepID=A0A1H5T148_9PSEU|nr:hypothetical protein [Saccharopolyspora kobensis]SEF56553.1 hypothetical protein SAMN02982929_00093 [Saccharopolyspora kobensis]SFC51590.1 hypothetical protein SAMN05216506_101939 [Saccharopolyspora kobensis]
MNGTKLSALGIIGLAALGVPRVIAHDLRLVGPVVNALLVFVPIAVWLLYVLWRRVPNPFRTLLGIGFAYGLMLAVAHQLLWEHAYAGNPPSLGGNLAGILPGTAEVVLMRGFAFVSSVATGTAVGAALGAVGWGLARLIPGHSPEKR